MNKKRMVTLAVMLLIGENVSAAHQNPASTDPAQSEIKSAISSASVGFHVGQYFQGGVIYWLDSSSGIPPQHGLIADIADQSGTYVWGNEGTLVNAIYNQAYAGKNNASANNGAGGNSYHIIQSGATSSAANACANDSHGGYTDWYLPSLMELSLMFVQNMTITQTSLQQSGGQAFAADLNTNYTYWSSTEYDSNHAWYYQSQSGIQNPMYESKSTLGSVRCVRAF